MLKPFVLYPTKQEAESSPFDAADRMICGVGCAETAASVAEAIRLHGQRLYVLAGIAGSYGKDLSVGETVAVTTERLVGHPLTIGKLYPLSFVPDSLKHVSSATVCSCGTSQHLSEIENMEGAVFAAICNSANADCCEIRSISNRVGDPRCEWQIDKAAENLNETLKKLFICRQKTSF